MKLQNDLKADVLREVLAEGVVGEIAKSGSQPLAIERDLLWRAVEEHKNQACQAYVNQVFPELVTKAYWIFPGSYLKNLSASQ